MLGEAVFYLFTVQFCWERSGVGAQMRYVWSWAIKSYKRIFFILKWRLRLWQLNFYSLFLSKFSFTVKTEQKPNTEFLTYSFLYLFDLLSLLREWKTAVASEYLSSFELEISVQSNYFLIFSFFYLGNNYIICKMFVSENGCWKSFLVIFNLI